MAKQNVVYPYSGMVLVHKKEWSTGTCWNMEKINKSNMLCKRSQTQKAYVVWFHLWELSRIGKSVEREISYFPSAGVALRDWGYDERQQGVLLLWSKYSKLDYGVMII